MSMANVCIVIVNYNGVDYQNDCIESLYKMNYNDFDIVVVDSGSHDNSIKLLKEKYPKVHCILMNDNVGVAKGNNVGIDYSRKSGAKYTLLLNNDTILDNNMLKELVLSASEDVVTVPKIYYFDNPKLLWYAGGMFNWNRGSVTHIGSKTIDQGQYDEEKYIEYSPTCCMLIDNTIFDKIGFIDEKVFMYCDDTDFCIRMFDNGIKIKYIPTSVVWHKVSSSSGGQGSKISLYYMHRNQLYLLKKHKAHFNNVSFFDVILKPFVKGMLFPFRKNKNERFICAAYFDYIIGKMGRKNF